MGETTRHDIDASFEAIIADGWYGPEMAVIDVANDAGRRLRILRVSALLSTVLCAAAVTIAFGLSVAAGVTMLAFSPVAVLAAVLTIDRVLGD